MYKKLLSVVALIAGAVYSHAMVPMEESPAIGCTYPSSTQEFTEDFESYNSGNNSYTHSSSGISFMLSGNLRTQSSFGLGINGSMNYVDNANDCLPSAGVVGSIRTNPRHDFYVKSFWIFPSQDCIMNGTNGSIIIRGKKDGLEVYSRTINSYELNDQQGINNGFTFVDMSMSYCGAIDQLEFEVTGSLRYVAVDDLKFMSQPIGGADPLSASITSQTNLACNGGSTGSATVSVNGGTSPYDYSWSNGGSTTNSASTSNTITGITAGNYTVTITDADGQTATANCTITQPTALSMNVNVDSHVSCNGGSDGVVTGEASGGTPPYYYWANGSTNPQVEGLSAGAITISVTDDNGCTAMNFGLVTQPDAIMVSKNITDATCALAEDGSIDLTISGGTEPFTFAWEDGPDTEDRTNLEPGTYNVTITDQSECSTQVSATVGNNDETDPEISCQEDLVVENEPGSCGAVVNYETPTFSDNCSGASILQIAGLASGSEFPIGITTNTFIITDAAGNTNTCSFDVTVEDVESPVINCVEDINTENDPGSCGAVVNYSTPAAFDNCPEIVFALIEDPMAQVTESFEASVQQIAGLSSGSTFPVGTTTNTFVATDPSGNTDTCSFTVTVNDVENPVFAFCPTNLGAAPEIGDCDFTVHYTTPEFTDNCPGATIEQIEGLASGSVFPQGTTNNVFEVTDAAGNTATCSFTVTVYDSQNPTISAPEAVTVSADEGSCEATQVVLGEASASDNCTVASVTNDAPESFPFGETVVTWTVTDGSGNSATATQTVTVEDNQNPSIVAPEAVTVSADEASCEASEVMLGEADASDNCTLAEVTNDAPEFFPVGETVVTWTAEDTAGNTATATQLVTVTDEEVPTIVAPESLVAEADSASCQATSVQLGEPEVSDNCSISMISNNAPDVFELGETDVVWTVIDESGNTATAVQTITVIDVEAPVADAEELPEIVVDCAVMELEAPTATDLCAGQIEGQHDAELPIMGTSTITWTFDDGSGNTVTQTQEVVVNGIDVSVTSTDTTLMANIEGATYQWIDCSNNSEIYRRTERTFNPFEDGTYAVRITKDICTEVSECYEVFATNISEVDLASQVAIFPNPNNGNFSITFSEQMKDVEVKVTDLRGRVISKKQFSEISKTEMQINEESGIYLVHIKSAKGSTVLRVVKNN